MHVRLALPLLMAAALVPACSSKKKAQTLPAGAPARAADRATAAPPSGVTVDSNGSAAGGVAFQPIYFDFDSSALSAAAQAELAELATHLGAHAQATVTIEGHADDRGTVEYNVALGERRAVAIRDHLVRLGVAPARLGVISFGEERPALAGADDDARSKNRRGELVLGQP